MNKIKKPNIDKLLASDDLNKSVIELDDYICALCEWGDNLEALTYPQMAFYFNQELEREINNGGFDQYFWNSAGMYANETVETLKLIGAEKTAKILEEAIAFFPDQQVPIEHDLRQEIADNIRETAEEKWSELDQRFYQYEESLNELNLEFVRANKEYF